MMKNTLSFHNYYIYNTWKTMLNIFPIEKLLEIDKTLYNMTKKPLYLYHLERPDNIEQPTNYNLTNIYNLKNIKIVLYKRDRHYIIDIIDYNKDIIAKIIRLHGTDSPLYISSLERENKREITYIIMSELEKKGLRTFYISLRDGFTIFLVEGNDKRIIVWIRESPITEKALKLFNKIIKKYEHDDKIIIKTKYSADYIKIPYKEEFITSIESAINIIEKLIYYTPNKNLKHTK